MSNLAVTYIDPNPNNIPFNDVFESLIRGDVNKYIVEHFSDAKQMQIFR